MAKEALELGLEFAELSLDIADAMRVEFNSNPKYIAMGGRDKLGQFTVAVAEIDGVRYAALPSRARPPQLEVFLREAASRGFVPVTDHIPHGKIHAEQALYEYARKVRGNRPMWKVIKAIGVSAIGNPEKDDPGGPCPKCRTWFAKRHKAGIPVYWLGRLLTATNTVGR
jgi:hypothetical protein